MKKNNVFIYVIIIAFFAFVYYMQHPALRESILSDNTNPNVKLAPSLPTSAPAVLGKQSKSNGCIATLGLQDKECTPGSIIPNVTTQQICTPGYSKSVRNVPTSIKQAVFAAYGILSHEPGQYEVDHLISLELGGSNDISNLWPESAELRPGFHEKDTVENLLHQQVCNGTITLQQAQQEISTNWITIYNQLTK